jgi:hypothetical protein
MKIKQTQQVSCQENIIEQNLYQYKQSMWSRHIQYKFNWFISITYGVEIYGVEPILQSSHGNDPVSPKTE